MQFKACAYLGGFHSAKLIFYSNKQTKKIVSLFCSVSLKEIIAFEGKFSDQLGEQAVFSVLSSSRISSLLQSQAMIILAKM